MGAHAARAELRGAPACGQRGRRQARGASVELEVCALSAHADGLEQLDGFVPLVCSTLRRHACLCDGLCAPRGHGLVLVACAAPHRIYPDPNPDPKADPNPNPDPDPN